jgi:hypothetical protein
LVADAHPELDPARELRDDDLVARVFVSGLGVHVAVDLDIEHVELAVHGPYLAVSTDVNAGVGRLLAPVHLLDDRPGHEIDPELARGRSRPRDAAAVERLGARGHLIIGPQHAPLLGQHDDLGPECAGLADQAIGGLEIAVEVLGGVKLDGADTHGAPPSPESIDQSVSPVYPAGGGFSQCGERGMP